MADFDTCATCCEGNHPSGADVFYGALQTCFCHPTNCKTACNATLCAATPASPDTACNTCIDGLASGACDADLGVCSSDADCTALNTCYNACPAPP
jgi:hypothetical protein